MQIPRAVLLLVTGILVSGSVSAATRQLAVFADGRVTPVSAGKAFSCDDEGLAFVFTETVNGAPPPQQLTLEEPEQETGSGNVRVEITQSCGQGEAVFDYAHDSATGSAADLDIAPEQFSISVSTTQGASASRSVSYRVIDDGDTEQRETFNLFGDQIVFFVGDTAGQATDRRDLLEIRIPANSENVVEPEDLPDDTTEGERETVDSLNEACRKAERGSELASTCDEIREAQDERDPDAPADPRGEQARRIAEAVNPGELMEATASALETIGRVQHENIVNRLASLRSGSRGVDVSGLQLAMNGHVMDMAWIQDYLEAESETGGGSRLLSEQWGIFVNGSISVGDEDFRQQSGYEFDIYDLTTGIDYRFNNGLILGGAVGLTKFESDIDADGGNLDSDSFIVQGFGTYNFTENFYLDGTAAYASGDVDQNRVIELSTVGSLSQQSVSGSTDSTQLSASLSLNYQTVFSNGWSLTNYGSFYFADTEVDELTEQGSSLALRYEKRQSDVLLSSLGLRVAKVFNFENGVMTAFADVAYKHESKDSVSVDTRFAAVDAAGPTVRLEDPDRNFGSAGFGGSWVFPSGNQLFLRFNTLVLDDFRNRSSVYLGARVEF